MRIYPKFSNEVDVRYGNIGAVSQRTHSLVPTTSRRGVFKPCRAGYLVSIFVVEVEAPNPRRVHFPGSGAAHRHALGGGPLDHGVPRSVSAAAHVQTLSDDYFASRNKYFLLLTAFTVVVAIVPTLTIYAAMSVITGSRVRETKLVRAIGGASIGILAAAVVEANVLGPLGVALGLPPGSRWPAPRPR